VLIGGDHFHQHKPWIAGTLVVTALCTGWFLLATQWDHDPPWPAGGSGPGLVFGVVGGIICLFEFLLWPRKNWWRARRFIRVKYWMQAHIWLGLLAVPVLILHSGLRFSNPLALATFALFLAVVASGVWGLVVQQFLPTRMLDDVPAETIASQIPVISAQLAHEAERLVSAVCGPLAGAPVQQIPDESPDFIVVGKVRVQGGTQGRVLQTQAVTAPVEKCEFLRDTFETTIKPYLKQGAANGSQLAAPMRAASVFSEIRVRIAPGAHDTLDAIAGLVEQRRQFDRQQLLHFWLHNWLWVHLPLSVALMVLMLVHTFVALRYLYTR
jgi:hypothetical protein